MCNEGEPVYIINVKGHSVQVVYLVGIAEIALGIELHVLVKEVIVEIVEESIGYLVNF